MQGFNSKTGCSFKNNSKSAPLNEFNLSSLPAAA